jgi:signal transduction histidine kinase
MKKEMPLMEKDAPYNSRVMRTYIEYLGKYYPQINVNELLHHAGIAPYELEDEGHWLTQKQHDDFHEILKIRTGREDIAREVGRFMTESKSFSMIRHYLLSHADLAITISSFKNIIPHVGRGSSYTIRQTAETRVEIIATPSPGVDEKPYQCENRIGTIEAIYNVLTNRFPKIDHPICIHKGGDHCLYIIDWSKNPVMLWKQSQPYALVLLMAVCIGSWYILPPLPSVIIALCSVIAILGANLFTENMTKKYLSYKIKNYSDSASLLMKQTNQNYNHALLMREIGQATVSILDVDEILRYVMETFRKRLDFDRGMIMLANPERTFLNFAAGYGYDESEEDLLHNTKFALANPRSKGQFVRAFWEQKPFFVNDINEVEEDLSPHSLEFAKMAGVQSFICVPIIYKGQSEGILAVDNVNSKRPLTQSDVSLLIGIASQIATSINNATIHRKIKDSYRELRELNKKLYEVEETQKRNISRELHDQLGQNLTALGISLNLINTLLNGRMEERLVLMLDDAISLVEQMGQQVSTLMSELRPAVLDDYGILAALRSHSQQCSLRTGISINIEGLELKHRLPLYVEATIFRIIQEAVNNVIKHANADHVDIILTQGNEELKFTIKDDGKGFDMTCRTDGQIPSGHGLAIMKERAELIEGRLTIESCRDKGTTVILEAPYAN